MIKDRLKIYIKKKVRWLYQYQIKGVKVIDIKKKKYLRK